MAANLNIHGIVNNPHMSMQLIHDDTGRSWSSAVSTDFAVNTGSTYNTPLADLLTGANDAYQTAKVAVGLVDEKLANMAPVPSLLTPAYSIMSWSNSERPTFNIPFTFVATSNSADVQKQAIQLASMALPSLDYELAELLSNGNIAKTVKSGIDFVKDKVGMSSDSSTAKTGSVRSPLKGLLVPPAGYAPLGDNAKGTFTLIVGQGAIRIDKLILQECSVEISKERLINGKPVWATATVTLVPYRIPTATEFASWFNANPGIADVVGKGILTELDSMTGNAISKASSAISGAVNTAKNYVTGLF